MGYIDLFELWPWGPGCLEVTLFGWRTFTPLCREGGGHYKHVVDFRMSSWG